MILGLRTEGSPDSALGQRRSDCIERDETAGTHQMAEVVRREPAAVEMRRCRDPCTRRGVAGPTTSSGQRKDLSGGIDDADHGEATAVSARRACRGWGSIPSPHARGTGSLDWSSSGVQLTGNHQSCSTVVCPRAALPPKHRPDGTPRGAPITHVLPSFTPLRRALAGPIDVLDKALERLQRSRTTKHLSSFWTNRRFGNRFWDNPD